MTFIPYFYSHEATVDSIKQQKDNHSVETQVFSTRQNFARTRFHPICKHEAPVIVDGFDQAVEKQAQCGNSRISLSLRILREITFADMDKFDHAA